MMKKPLLSVIMAVYNGESYLNEAIDSILKQTFKNWELILIDDCSTDKTPELLSQYTDSRIHILRNEKNLRLAASLNRGLKEAKGDYILRMDADDVCRPDRFERQLAFMEAHPDVDLSWGKTFHYRDGEILPSPQPFYNDPDYIKALFLFTCQVMHSCLIARRSLYEAHTYHTEFRRSEDWNLWYRSSPDFKFMQQEEYLLLYRIHSGQVTDIENLEPYREEYRKNFTEYLQSTGIHTSATGIDFQAELICGRERIAPKRLLHWFLHLKKENERLSLYKENALFYAFSWMTFQLFQAKRLSTKELLQVFRTLGFKHLISYVFGKLFLLLKDAGQQKKDRKKFSCL